MQAHTELEHTYHTPHTNLAHLPEEIAVQCPTLARLPALSTRLLLLLLLATLVELAASLTLGLLAQLRKAARLGAPVALALGDRSGVPPGLFVFLIAVMKSDEYRIFETKERRKQSRMAQLLVPSIRCENRAVWRACHSCVGRLDGCPPWPLGTPRF